MALILLPSVVALEQLRENIRPPQASKRFIGFGNPSFTGQAEERGNLRQVEQVCDQVNPELIRQLEALPETAEELRRLANSVGSSGSRLVLGDQARVETVQAADLQDYQIIAFATHALLPSADDCLPEPAIALTPSPEEGGRNGLLYASDIAGLKLDASWVVLSACSTGGEGRLGGESLSGLATAFFYAGARALQVSHWAVYSSPTVILTTGTFDRYTRNPGRGRAEALRQTQLAMLEDSETAHPVFWGAFTLVGSSIN
jgi:CHAT domain-containing protein